MKKTNTLQDNKQGREQLSTKALQEIARPYAKQALERLIEIVQLKDTERNASNIIGASKILLSKVLPDLKSSELGFDEHSQLLIQILTGHGNTTNTQPQQTPASSDRSDAESTTPIQGVSVASQSTKDNDTH